MHTYTFWMCMYKRIPCNDLYINIFAHTHGWSCRRITGSQNWRPTPSRACVGTTPQRTYSHGLAQWYSISLECSSLFLTQYVVVFFLTRHEWFSEWGGPSKNDLHHFRPKVKYIDYYSLKSHVHTNYSYYFLLIHFEVGIPSSRSGKGWKNSRCAVTWKGWKGPLRGEKKRWFAI